MFKFTFQYKFLTIKANDVTVTATPSSIITHDFFILTWQMEAEIFCNNHCCYCNRNAFLSMPKKVMASWH